MTLPDETRSLPTAGARRALRIPLIWIVPLLTALLAGWLAWDTLSKRGPTITISFSSAEGLQAGQSQLRFRDVVMGTVKSIHVAPDLANVTVTVETVREAERLLNDKTVFWVVKPQLFAGRVMGLDTLLSGSYIGMLPAPGDAEPRRSFVGSEDPPILPTAVPGTTFGLTTTKIGSLSLGSPIFFRDLNVGTVLGWDLSDMARHVTVQAFVRAPFDKYVRDDSLFWNASGISVKLGVNGIEVQLESIKALLLGGIAFDTRTSSTAPVAAEGHVFPLYADHEGALAAGFGRRLQLVSYFSGSVSGLAVGAEVTLHGLKIGEVTDVGLVYDPKVDRILAPVRYQIEGDRIAGVTGAREVPLGTVAAEMVRHGFRATLQAPNLITGQKIVAIQVMPDAAPAELGEENGTFVVPTSEAGSFDTITRGASELLSKINRIDFDAIGKSIAGASKGLDETINGPQLKRTLASLESAMADVRDIAAKLDKNASPALDQLPAIARQLQDALTRISRLAGSLNTAYGSDSRFAREIDRLMPQLNDTARSFRALADLLSRHPEALIRGRTNTGRE